MVPAPRQALLTRFGTGALEEADFLSQVDWPAIWGHDPELYAPLLRWARQQRVPLLALNVEPAVVRRVRREGLSSIPPEAREGIGSPVPATAAYRQRLRTVWQVHRAMGQGSRERSAPLSAADADDLERFIASQLLRDRAMAERLAAAHRHDPDRLVVALMGRGHLEDDDGVPRQLRHLGVEAVLALWRPVQPDGCGPAPTGARLGAYLESGDGAVWVRQVAPGSAGARAGLRPGDRLLFVNGEPVRRAGQVIRRVRELQPGVPLRLSIERDGRRQELEVRLPTASTVGPPGRMEDRQPSDRSASP
jgi:membrane-associated protease RseP (regulator of RpoE activity)